jgi:hypothetical protein
VFPSGGALNPTLTIAALYSATDDSDNETTAEASVRVEHDQRK